MPRSKISARDSKSSGRATHGCAGLARLRGVGLGPANGLLHTGSGLLGLGLLSLLSLGGLLGGRFLGRGRLGSGRRLLETHQYCLISEGRE